MNYKILGEPNPGFDKILTSQACEFLSELQREFGSTRNDLLKKRVEFQERINSGDKPDFLSSTENIRNSDWSVNTVPKDLQDRRVEITGPTDRKMVINALNCGAKVFMADFEDSNAPTWFNMVDGQINLRDAVNRTITFTNPNGKHYSLKDKTATLLARVRGLHLDEKHFLVDGKPIFGGLFDFGLYFFHNARNLLDRDSGPYFYLPKLQSHLEARLWNSVFEKAQDTLNIPRGTIKATCLVETLPAAFETEEFLYELRQHTSGLNCGRWDYIFSFIKTFQNNPSFILPDRSQVTMASPFMAAYCKHVVETCHKRGAHAMGGMAAQIPIKNDPEANEAAFNKVRQDKEREVDLGHDGTWVAHPGLVETALKAFEKMPTANQINKKFQYNIKAEDLMRIPHGTITEAGLRSNVSIGVQYIESWIRGEGCVPLYNLMEDAATSEISRTQIWQWIQHKCKADDIEITRESFEKILSEELQNIEKEIGNERFSTGRFTDAAKLFSKISTDTKLAEFLTLPAYELL